tara:strand:- start:247 stop:891 length:645 start_codon:yes stop_codon:yes gene_type:complete
MVRSDAHLGWEVEVAAMVSQLGSVTLENALAERFYGGAVLSDDEIQRVESIPSVSAKLLGSIPRLEGVLAILNSFQNPPGDAADLPPGSDLLLVAEGFLHQLACKRTPEQAIAELRKLEKHHGHGRALALLEQNAAEAGQTRTIMEMPLKAVKVGMVFAEDIFLDTGVLLVANGYTATESFVERSLNMSSKRLPSVVQVYVPTENAEETESIAV